MAEPLIDGVKHINRVDGFWVSSNTYLLSTPNGYAVLTYDSYLWMGMQFIYQGRRYERSYERLKKRHAVTLLKRFYYEVING